MEYVVYEILYIWYMKMSHVGEDLRLVDLEFVVEYGSYGA